MEKNDGIDSLLAAPLGYFECLELRIKDKAGTLKRLLGFGGSRKVEIAACASVQ